VDRRNSATDDTDRNPDYIPAIGGLLLLAAVAIAERERDVVEGGEVMKKKADEHKSVKLSVFIRGEMLLS